jgi:hypothetical protein
MPNKMSEIMDIKGKTGRLYRRQVLYTEFLLGSMIKEIIEKQVVRMGGM